MTKVSGSPIATLYKRSFVVRQFHSVPPASAALLTGLARQLLAAGFCQTTARAHLRGALHVAVWAKRNGIVLRSLSAADADVFVEHAVRCRCIEAGSSARWAKRRRRKVRAGLRVLRGFLHTGAVGPWGGDPAPARAPLIRDFEAWLTAHRGLTVGTVRHYAQLAAFATASIGMKPAAYTPLMIRRFVMSCWKGKSPSSLEVVVRVLRHFIAFLSARGLCDVDLEGALPRIRSSRPAPPPFVLTRRDLDRTLDAGGSRQRDRALLLLMFRLGLRTSDLAGLRLGDVNWRNGTILVSGKNRREERLPLPQDVGDALLAYLRKERPRRDCPFVFLRTRAPHAPIGRTGIAVMRRAAMERAGIKLPQTRTHLTRHSVASDILRTAVPLAALQRLLRHRRISTTGTYCHVDQAVLRSVCQPWPL